VQDYYADKALLFRNAGTASRWVTNADDEDVRRIVGGVAGDHYRYSLVSEAEAFLDGSGLVLFGGTLMRRSELPLLGDHNVANALAAALAVTVALPEHASREAQPRIAAALSEFRALEHRIEPVAEVNGVLWINDSKSTNVMSTLMALRGMDRPTILLLGGRHKGEPYSALSGEVERTVKLVVAYGEAAGLVEADMAELVPVERVGSSFDDAIARARNAARPGDVVLLSPACSSFDMFTDYEERGREFKRLALEVDG
jgi:UDP-N-acetylmuramoylalanine--D-glutamate ligase